MKSLKQESIEGWYKAWNFLYSATPILLVLTIIMFFSTNYFTWYGINHMNLIEKNFLLHPLFNKFGVEYVFVYGFFASTIIFAFYKLTRKRKIIYIHVIIILTIFLASSMNFMNDFGLVIKYPPLYDFFQRAPLNNAFKILGINIGG